MNASKELVDEINMDLVDKGTGSEADIRTLDKIYTNQLNWIKSHKEILLNNYELN